MTKTGEDGDNVSMMLGGCQIQVVFADPDG